ncbi:4193_t:CDS:1 [Diversispora eburnea]|uniref:4193_t:CDS:1 n=1 Tax=Diversispora eburnea TaxID=1213867 RepID=A0A9N9BK55_9GLOM|nr:4193_t:CDS:1 [Diversispora eburnea]
MNQKITFATILIAFSVFFICFTNASPIELSPRKSPLVVCEYSQSQYRVYGNIWVTPNNENCKVHVNFAGGRSSCHYVLYIDGCESEPISFKPDGCAEYTYRLEGRSPAELEGKTCTLYENGTPCATGCFESK